MSTTVTTLVLLAALLHALWNALVKAGEDRLIMVTWIAVGGSVLTLPLALTVFPLPPPAVWPLLGLSLLVHTGYKLFLARAYQHGDFGQVYPLARGAAPLIVTAAGFWLLGERPDAARMLAIILLTAAVVSLARRPAHAAAHDPRGVIFALITSCFIAAYTVNDGVASRLAGSAHVYAVWLFALDGWLILLAALYMRSPRALWQARRLWITGLTGGAMSVAAFWIVIWAMSIAPLGPVSALRESSVVIAALISTVFMGEGHSRQRLLAAALAFAGIILLNTPGGG